MCFTCLHSTWKDEDFIKNSSIHWVSNVLNTDFLQQIFNKPLLSMMHCVWYM